MSESRGTPIAVDPDGEDRASLKSPVASPGTCGRQDQLSSGPAFPV